MLWLDSVYPPEKAGEPGTARGSCSTDSGKPPDIEKNAPSSKVIYSNIRFGPIGSTTTFNTPGDNGGDNGGSSSSTTRRITTTTSRTSQTTMATSTTTRGGTGGPTQTKWGQCGGKEYVGPTQCVSGSSCNAINEWYSQCL